MNKLKALLPLLAAVVWSIAADRPTAALPEPARFGTLVGTVYDLINGAPIPGAHVYVMRSDIGALSDTSGQYVIERVPVGSYMFMSTAVNYVTRSIDSIAITADDTTRLDIHLPPMMYEFDSTIHLP